MTPLQCYGVIDLASAVALRSKVVRLGPPAGCSLLDEETFLDCLAVGPWLIDLGLCPDIGARWRRDVHDYGLGYMIHTRLSLADLRLHLRKFALAELEGQAAPVLFRYFDARIIRSFLLEGFTPEQRTKFMAPISRLEVKTGDGQSTHVFTPDDETAPDDDNDTTRPPTGNAPRVLSRV